MAIISSKLVAGGVIGITEEKEGADAAKLLDLRGAENEDFGCMLKLIGH
jgi:hypothetical protein